MYLECLLFGHFYPRQKGILYLQTGSEAPLYGLGYPRQPFPWVNLGELTLPCVVVEFKQPFMWISPGAGQDNSSFLNNPGRPDNFSSCKHLGSPNWDNCRHGECYDMSRLRVLKQKFVSRKWLHIWLSLRVMNIHAWWTLTLPAGKRFSHINTQ